MNKQIFCRIAAWLLLAGAIVWCASCANLYENTWEQRFERPSSDMELPTNPPWDSLPEVATPEIGR